MGKSWNSFGIFQHVTLDYPRVYPKIFTGARHRCRRAWETGDLFSARIIYVYFFYDGIIYRL